MSIATSMPERSAIARMDVVELEARTVPALLVRAAASWPERVFLRVVGPEDAVPPTATVTFGRFEELVRSAAAWMQGIGLGPGRRLLLSGENSPAWQVLSIGAQLLRAEPVALFANLESTPAVDALLRTRPQAVFCSTLAQARKLLPALARGSVAHLVCGEEVPAGELPPSVRLWRTNEVLATPPLAPADARALAQLVRRDDVFVILFTSGTSGRSKGVRVGQDGFVHGLDAFQRATAMSTRDTGVMLLPFGHVAGQAQFHLALASGQTLLLVSRREDISRALALGPTYVFAVPFLYEKMRAAVEAKLASLPPPVASLARLALAAAGRTRCDGSRRIRDRIFTVVADLLIGRGLRRRLGGRIRALFAGGAATPPHLWRFFESLDIPYVEGFGLSETSSFIASQSVALPRRAGSVGRTSSDVETRLADDGELLVRGRTLMLGYLDGADEADAFTPDGFFKTGDLAAVAADGTLCIVGRKKFLVVLSTGKKVCPEPIESKLQAALAANGVVLFGEGRPFVAAAVFLPSDDLASLRARAPDPERELLARTWAALADCSEFERPKRLLLLSGSPHDHPEILTPSLKLKREAFLGWQAPAIETLYGSAEGEQRRSAR